MLTRLFLQQWSMDNYADQIGNRNISFAVEDKCFMLSVNDGKVFVRSLSQTATMKKLTQSYFSMQSMHQKTVRPQ